MIFDDKFSIYVIGIHYSRDGTVLLKLSDNRKLKLYAQNWIAMNHSKEKILSESQLEKLEYEANYTKIREKILKLLAVRDHSVFELQRKIKNSFLNSRISNFSSLFERCLLEFQKCDFQSDERFTRHFIKSKIENKQYGPFKILQDLQNRGISRELSQPILGELSEQGLWVDKAVQFLEKFHKRGESKDNLALSQKLYQRGFSWDIIQQAMEKFQSTLDQSDIIELDDDPKLFQK